MTTKKKTATGQRKTGKLKLKKEIVKDLDPKGKGVDVRAGMIPRSIICSTMKCSVGCPTTIL